MNILYVISDSPFRFSNIVIYQVFLKVGLNVIPGIPLQLNVEEVLEKNFFKITPVRFSTECPTTYELAYLFLNFTERPNVQMQLTPEASQALL